MTWLNLIPGPVKRCKLSNLDYSFIKLLFRFRSIELSDEHISIIKEYARIVQLEKEDATVEDLLKDESLLSLIASLGKSVLEEKLTKSENASDFEAAIAKELNSVIGMCPSCGTECTLVNFANNYGIRS